MFKWKKVTYNYYKIKSRQIVTVIKVRWSIDASNRETSGTTAALLLSWRGGRRLLGGIYYALIFLKG